MEILWNTIPQIQVQTDIWADALQLQVQVIIALKDAEGSSD